MGKKEGSDAGPEWKANKKDAAAMMYTFSLLANEPNILHFLTAFESRVVRISSHESVREVRIHNVIEKELGYCINVLKSNQVEIADICSKKENERERFSKGNWLLFDEIPYFADAQSVLFCRCINLIEHETHTIFLGEVTKVMNKNISNPLLYKDGRYLD